MLLLRYTSNTTVSIEYHESRAGRALINRSDIPFHVSRPRCASTHSQIREFLWSIRLWQQPCAPNPNFFLSQARSLRLAPPPSIPSNRTTARRFCAPIDPQWFPPFRFGCSTQFPPGLPAVRLRCALSRTDFLEANPKSSTRVYQICLRGAAPCRREEHTLSRSFLRNHCRNQQCRRADILSSHRELPLQPSRAARRRSCPRPSIGASSTCPREY